MQSNLLKTSMINGLIMGVLFSLNFLISVPKNTILGILSYFIMAAIVVIMYRMAIRYRDNDCEGYISYGKVFSLIIYTFFFGALISSLVKYIYFKFIDTTYLDNLLQESLKTMEAMKFTVDDNAYNQMSEMMKPASMALQYIWVNMLGGLVVGLIMSAFVKKEKSIFED